MNTIVMAIATIMLAVLSQSAVAGSCKDAGACKCGDTCKCDPCECANAKSCK